MTANLMMRAVKGQAVDRPPVWMMRQAGRYLPEYHEVKQRAGGFLGLCKKLEYGVEATLQPVRRFGFDAAILFSDILIPAAAMGISLDFNPGPIIANPIRTDGDVAALKIPTPEEDLGFVLDILRALKGELPPSVALIGFAGAPFTVASYMVEGGSPSRGFETTRRMIYARPDLLRALLAKVTETTIHYLRAQIQAGAEIVQLFDSSVGQLPPHIYRAVALPFVKEVVSGLTDSGAPVIYFAPGAMISLGAMADIDVDVLGIDYRIGLAEARQHLGPDKAVQGNLDPAVLLGSKDSVRENTQRILSENAGRPGHIFNLGHGVLPTTPIESVETLVETVHSGTPDD
ncbi:MAG: uroporphyrinogen decarboxylase [Myxococcota bacterium]|nr:uroporphyrinogen decarboxylase [Myxococcota bacterium]